MNFNVRHPLAWACIPSILSGLAISWRGLGAVPDYETLFGAVTGVVGLTIVTFLFYRQRRVENLARRRAAPLMISLGASFFLFLGAYLYLVKQVIIEAQDRGAVFFPLVLTGDIADLVDSRDGSRKAVLQEYGHESTRKKVHKMPYYDELEVLTLIVLLTVYQGVFSSALFIFLLFALNAVRSVTAPFQKEGLTEPEARQRITILFLSANPRDTERLRIDEELREIELRLREGDLRDIFELKPCFAVRARDLQGHLLRHRPQILHFSGHGSDSGIYLEDLKGESQVVSSEALRSLFSALKGHVRCVVLNACYSFAQAAAIESQVDCIVGMSNAMPDKSAISFSFGFYQALGYGKDFKTAFELGRNQIVLDKLPGSEIPSLLSRKEPSYLKLFETDLSQAE